MKSFHLPLDADGHEGHNWDIEAEDEGVALHPAHHRSQQPASVQHEQRNLRHAEQHDEEIGGGQVQDKEIGDRAAHFPIRHYHPDNEEVSNNSYQTNEAK